MLAAGLVDVGELVRIAERGERLLEEPRRLRGRQRPLPPDQVAERHPGDELHDQEIVLLGREELIDPHDPGVVELRLDVGLAPEPRPEVLLRARREGGQLDHLDNDLARQVEVPTAVDAAHAAVRQLARDLIIPDDLADQCLQVTTVAVLTAPIRTSDAPRSRSCLSAASRG